MCSSKIRLYIVNKITAVHRHINCIRSKFERLSSIVKNEIEGETRFFRSECPVYYKTYPYI